MRDWFGGNIIRNILFAVALITLPLLFQNCYQPLQGNGGVYTGDSVQNSPPIYSDDSGQIQVPPSSDLSGSHGSGQSAETDAILFECSLSSAGESGIKKANLTLKKYVQEYGHLFFGKIKSEDETLKLNELLQADSSNELPSSSYRRYYSSEIELVLSKSGQGGTAQLSIENDDVSLSISLICK